MTRHSLFMFVPVFAVVMSLDLRAQERTLTAQGYSIVVPDDWEQVIEEKTILTVRGPLVDETDLFAENVRIISHPIKRNVTVDEALAAQKMGLGKFKMIGEGKVVGSKHPMTWLAITPKVPEDEKDERVKIDFMSVRGKSLVVLHAMVELDQWEKHMPSFTKIAQSFTMPAE